MQFKNGDAVKPLKKIGKTKKRGTEISFKPSNEIFSDTKFSFSSLDKRMRELAFLNKGLSIKLVDNRLKKKEQENKYDGGIEEFVNYNNNKKPKISKQK